MKISENTSVAMPVKNMIGIVVAVAMGVFAYTEVTARLTSLETSRELFQADLLKKSEQLPTDQEQYMLIEDLYKTTEKLEITQEQNMTNKVNIEFLKAQLEKALEDVEQLKDKVRAMATGRINKKVLDHIAAINKEAKEIQLSKNLKKEVETGKNGTQKYVIKQGENKGKTV